MVDFDFDLDLDLWPLIVVDGNIRPVRPIESAHSKDSGVVSASMLKTRIQSCISKVKNVSADV